jgi:acid phosphatase type 7
MMRLLERLNTPTAVLVVLFAAVAANSYLYFAYYLPATSSASAARPGLEATYPDLEKKSKSFSPRPTLPVRTGDPLLVGAGDIASCASSGDEATAKLIDRMPNATVFTLGDNVYEDGTAFEFADCYDPSWGRFKARTNPAVGNHEYQTPDATGYYYYFGSAAGDPKKGYYSYDLGAWHIISLNSMCGKVRGCGATSPMGSWLKKDLTSHPARCTLAYFHHPLFSSGSEHGNDPRMRPIWEVLYAADAEVVINGHDHDYERFAPQTPVGVRDPAQGIREFVVGTGGDSLYAFLPPKPNSQVRNVDTYGVLKLTLHPGSYEWEFVPVAGKTFTDSGSGECH